MIRTDILISGAGLAGLVAAAAMHHAGYNVLVVDPARQTPGHDLRSTAYLQPARTLLDQIGLWSELAPHTTALDALRIIDTSGWPPRITETRTFQPTDLGATSFGWNIPNAIARDVLTNHLARQTGVHILSEVAVRSVLTRTTDVRTRLSDGQLVVAKLLIGADGRDSTVRDAVDIPVKTNRYGQKALAFHATHARAHDNISTEIYNQGGAFTSVPLPDHNGAPCSAIVWMNDGPEISRLHALAPDAFDAEMTARACATLGPMQRAGNLSAWPVISQRAERLTAQRTVLIAEAAHVLPPIGAQGLNTSLNDITALCDLVKDGNVPLGDPAQLALYEKRRASDITTRMRAIDMFNRICRSGQPAIQALRSTGLRAVYDFKPVRQGLMRAGISAT